MGGADSGRWGKQAGAMLSLWAPGEVWVSDEDGLWRSASCLNYFLLIDCECR